MQAPSTLFILLVKSKSIKAYRVNLGGGRTACRGIVSTPLRCFVFCLCLLFSLVDRPRPPPEGIHECRPVLLEVVPDRWSSSASDAQPHFIIASIMNDMDSQVSVRLASRAVRSGPKDEALALRMTRVSILWFGPVDL
jgi:hypothetical protein